MDLAFLVYGISLLYKIGAFAVACIIVSVLVAGGSWIWYISETDRKSYYTDQENDVREANGVMCVKWLKRSLVTIFLVSFALIFLPSEKTAYTMVGAYAAQKVAENDKVQEMSGKVLTIIEQKLDSIIEDGVKEAQAKVDKEIKKK